MVSASYAVGSNSWHAYGLLDVAAATYTDYSGRTFPVDLAAGVVAFGFRAVDGLGGTVNVSWQVRCAE